MRPLNTDAFLYVKLTAQQVDDERTTADMQAHNSCCAVHDSDFSRANALNFLPFNIYI